MKKLLVPVGLFATSSLELRLWCEVEFLCLWIRARTEGVSNQEIPQR